MNYEKELEKFIPGGAHTYSRGKDQFPSNAPAIATSGNGAYLFGADGKKYLDYSMGLRSVTIGYNTKDINNGAIKEIKNGNNLSKPSIIELKAAKTFVNLIPGAEMVKFAKHGSSVTTAAVKLARSYTKKEIICFPKEQPFFSFDDWFIGSTKVKRGVLKKASKFSKVFRYNDISSLLKIFKKYPNNIAGVILEPATTLTPCFNNCQSYSFKNNCKSCNFNKKNFLKLVRALCDKYKSLLILDEMITGFRWSIKGAQDYFNVKPDLSTFGKGMANGFSLSALVGKKELMDLGSIGVENRVFLLSSTHGAEMCSLGAFVATMDFYEKNDVVSHLKEYGSKLIHMMNEVSSYHELADFFIVDGLPWLPRYTTNNLDGQRDSDLTMLFQQEMARHKVLMRNIIICYRHGERELELTRDALDKSLVVYKKALDNGVSRYLEKI